jgi:hypothetical protein
MHVSPTEATPAAARNSAEIPTVGHAVPVAGPMVRPTLLAMPNQPMAAPADGGASRHHHGRRRREQAHPDAVNRRSARTLYRWREDIAQGSQQKDRHAGHQTSPYPGCQ